MSKKKCISINNKAVIVTGGAGFIGAHLIDKLLKVTENVNIINIDNMNSYYDCDLKKYRLLKIADVEKECSSSHIYIKGSITDKELLRDVFEKYNPSVVINLAAQAGVRNSIDNPDIYVDCNINGFFNILEMCRRYSVEHLVYASSSSVYGGSLKTPFSEDDNVDNPISLYAATKKADELMAYCYSQLYNIPSTGLRFFTVYGPAGRPDMAYFIFAEKLKNNKDIDVYNYGKCKRDFTYIDDIVNGIATVVTMPPQLTKERPPHEVYNIGYGKPVDLLEFIEILSDELVSARVLDSNFSLEEHLNFLPMQRGDVPVTFADTTKLYNDFGVRPVTDLRTGIRRFVDWYKTYYSNNVFNVGEFNE